MTLPFDDLERLAAAALARAGLDGAIAAVVAHRLVVADAMGHDTHGLALLPDYVEELQAGAMNPEGGPPAVIADRGAAVTWDGARRPGVWLADRAMQLAVDRARRFGVAVVAIRASHHIGCLAAFLPIATAAGMVGTIACSDPSAAMVAPAGGLSPVFTPDPLAVGIPTGGEPILIDISASITTAAMSARLRREGRRFPGPWAQDARGLACDDPAVLVADPPGSLLPVGGHDHGHKGTGLALIVEALSQGLAGQGRADTGLNWGAEVVVQAIDPDAFAGRAAFLRQTAAIAARVRASPPRDPARPVRLPGAAAMQRLAAARAGGVALRADTRRALEALAARLGLAPPGG